MKAALLMVDMSNEQVASLSETDKSRIVSCIQRLAASDMWTLKLDSRLWLNDDRESTLSWVYPEWGVSMGIPHSKGAALIPELALQDLSWQFVPKKHYSSFVDSPIQEICVHAGITHIYIVGINTDYCIFDTALDAFSRGRFRTWVVEQGVGSVSGTRGHEQGLQWIRAHLGSQAVVSWEAALQEIEGHPSAT